MAWNGYMNAGKGVVFMHANTISLQYVPVNARGNREVA